MMKDDSSGETLNLAYSSSEQRASAQTMVVLFEMTLEATDALT